VSCKHFDDGCCTNETVVSEYRREWGRPSYVLGIGPPLCRKYCPYLSDSERRRVAVLAEGENATESENSGAGTLGDESKDGKSHRMLFTPLPKFWLNDDCTCITFEIDFSETMYYHMTLLGWCEWEIPERLTVEIPIVKKPQKQSI